MHPTHLLRTTSFLVLTLTSLAVAGASSHYTYQYNSDGTIEYNKSDSLHLDSVNPTDEQKSSISFDNFNAPDPADCARSGYACQETTDITVTTRKVWTVVRVPSITSTSLDQSTFATYYPDLTPDAPVTPTSPLPQRMVAQRLLYDLGLLPVLPTGKFGYKTELATIDLQCRYGIDEYDATAGKTILGPQSVAKLNELKDQMKDPNFDPATALPPATQCSDTLSNRENDIKAALGTPGGLTRGTPAPADASSSTQPAGNLLQMSGQIQVWKQ